MRTLIIAEAGVNHNGQTDLALELVEAAARSGADIVKFQTFRAEDLVREDAPKAEYQKENDSAVTQFEMLKKLELSHEDYRAILEKCKAEGVEFMSTPFSVADARFLHRLGMQYWKISSGEITNLPLLRYVASVARRLILSTGMCTIGEIEEALAAVEAAGLDRPYVTLLHCTTAYPTPLADVNLRAMETLRKLKVGGVGYSDHTSGVLVPVAAVAMGAEVIEKHLTLDRTLPGPDHKASLTPDEFQKMVREIRNVETAMGNADKVPTTAEMPNIKIARKSIVAAHPISQGEVFTAENITTKRPGLGLSPMLWDTVIGTKATRNYATDDFIEI